MIELLNFVVSIEAVIAELTCLVVIAKNVLVVNARSAAVFEVMMKQTDFEVMGI